jgi:hypothetical protein
LHGCTNDDVLWAALFVLAVLVRDSSAVFGRASAALAQAGILQVNRDGQGCWQQAAECAFHCSML